MELFYDYFGSKVHFSFFSEEFNEEAEHVIVICYKEGQWLLTKHKKRGLEFPGGKSEAGESIEAAAKREVYEETGALIKELHWVAQYEVFAPNKSFCKAVYFAHIDQLIKKVDYFETDGPILLTESEIEKRSKKMFSYIMKDSVMDFCLQHIKEKFLSLF